MAKEKKEKRMPYKKLLAKIRLGLSKPEKYTQDGLNKYIRDKGWTEEEFKEATVNHATIQVKKDNPKSYWGTAKGYMREVFDGITIGYSNTVDSYLTAIVNNDGIKLPSKDELEYTKQLIAQERADYQEANPVYATGANIAGAMTAGAGIVGGLYKIAPKLAATAGGSALGNFGKDLGVNIATGVGEGALYAYNTEQDVGEGAEFGGKAGAGATLATRALHPIAKGIGKGVDKLKSFTSRKDAKKTALERIEEDYELDRVDPEQQLLEFEKVNLGDEVRAGNLGGPNVQQTAKDAVNARGLAKTDVRKGLQEDLESNRGLTTGSFKEGLGFNQQGSDYLRDDIIEQMKKTAQPYYDEAYALPPINNPDLDRVLQTIHKTTKGDFYENAKAIAEREIELLPKELRDNAILPDEMPFGNIPVAVVDFYKQSLDDLIGSAKGNNRRTLIALKNKMLGIVDDATKIKPPEGGRWPDGTEYNTVIDPATKEIVPQSKSLVEIGESPYARARAIWSEGMDNTRAYELGEKAYSTKSAKKIDYEFNNLKSEAEKDLYRLGASTEAVTQMNRIKADSPNAAKKLLDPESKEKHAILFGDQQKSMEFINRLEGLSNIYKSNTGMMPRSDTGANLMRFTQDMINYVSTGGSLPRKAAVVTGRAVAGKLMRDRELAINEEAGKLLSTKGAPAIRQNVIEPLKQLKKDREGEFSQSLINRGLLTGALTSTEAQMMGGGSLLD